MSERPPSSDDPLAALAKAAQKAVHADDATRTARLAQREAETAGRRRLARAVSMVVLVAVVVGVLVFQGPRMADPYHGEDPLADPGRAKAYVTGLLDVVFEWRAQNGGRFPTFLGQAVPQKDLPDSPYQVQYRVESDAPVLTLEGGREPVVARGAAR